MAKIPQGEWSAIAERYSRGESISSIARRYGCAAPAIHYILKRYKERAIVSNQRPALAPTLTKPEVSQPARIGGGENGRSSSLRDARKAPKVQVILPPAKEHNEQMRERDFAPLMKPVPTEGRPTAALQLQRAKAQRVNRASALTAGLDAELRDDAEVAIQAFRSGFDAALAENSPVTRERLRQMASDLMRAAARTTIVLDRLSAGAERAVK
jgi:transposase-like protein